MDADGFPWPCSTCFYALSVGLSVATTPNAPWEAISAGCFYALDVELDFATFIYNNPLTTLLSGVSMPCLQTSRVTS